MRHISQSVRDFLEFKSDDSQNYDPLSPLLHTLTIESAKEVDNYYNLTIKMRDEEIRQLKEVIVNMEKDKLNKAK